MVFPGNLQGRHVKEEGSKGASVVTVAAGRVAAVEHVALDVVRWLRLPVDVTGAADEPAVLSLVCDALERAVLLAEDRLLVVRIGLLGACPAHADIAREPEGLRERVRGAASGVAGRDDLWIEDVRLATSPALDLAAMRGQPGPVGALVQALDVPFTVDAALQGFVADQLRRAGSVLEPDHPALAILAGHAPEDLVARARALLLAELARG